MSIWPYRPMENWSERFNRLCKNVTQAIHQCHADLVIAACGCYGIPLADHMASTHPNSRYRYFGQVMNASFGVLTNSAKLQHPFWRVAPNSMNWSHAKIDRR